MSEDRSPYEPKGPDFESAPTSPTPPAASQEPWAPESPYAPQQDPVPDYYVDPSQQAAYQQVQPQPYQQPMYQPQPGYGTGWAPAPEHPRATTVLVLGILGFLFGIPAFFGWYMGSKAKKEIQRGAPYRWDGALKVGHILSIVASVLTIAVVALYLFMFFVLIAMAGMM